MTCLHSRLASAVVLAFVTFTLPACWNKNFNEPGRIEVDPVDTDMTIGGGFQRVWTATQASMAKFPIVKRDADTASGRAYLVTDWIRGKSDVLYHGFDVNRVPYIIRYKFYIYLVSDARNGKVRVSIKNTEEYLDDAVTAGVDIQGSAHVWVKTQSSTLKENSMLQQIEKLVRDPKFKSEPE